MNILDAKFVHRMDSRLDLVGVFTPGLGSPISIHLTVNMWAHCSQLYVLNVPPNDLYNFIESSEPSTGSVAVVNDGDNYGGDHVSALKDWFQRPILLRRIAWSEANSISTIMYP